MKIKLSSVLVTDQAKALAFYTGKLGFVKKQDIPAGEFRFLTVVSPDAPAGVELLLEPNAHPAARTFQKAIFADEIPATAFAVDDIRAEHIRLEKLGVRFTKPPTPMGAVTLAVFDDTCGNLIQIYQA